VGDEAWRTGDVSLPAPEQPRSGRGAPAGRRVAWRSGGRHGLRVHAPARPASPGTPSPRTPPTGGLQSLQRLQRIPAALSGE